MLDGYGTRYRQRERAARKLQRPSPALGSYPMRQQATLFKQQDEHSSLDTHEVVSTL